MGIAGAISRKTWVEIIVTGVVQGVGFRPFVYRLARERHLDGVVRNTPQGVGIQVGLSRDELAELLAALRKQAPPLARINDIQVTPLAGGACPPGFHIQASRDTGRAATLVTPDIATCEQCLEEILDPADRRYHYPFTNCTNCGPRLTIIDKIPYDRKNTSMQVFTMCDRCAREYHDPGDRRFHAQPNACPRCGPRLSWHGAGGERLSLDDCLGRAARSLARGHIVAIKGLGGFQLAVDGCDQAAVERLRRRKNRPAKPLAIMAADVAQVARIARFGREERDLLTSPQCPIVLLEKRSALLAEAIAPGLGEVGVMLPPTPLHHLLLRQPACPDFLVMTSGNRSDEPLCIGNQEAVTRLAGIADRFLLHDRRIVVRVDDSVVRLTRLGMQMVRRARGFVPLPLSLAQEVTGLLGCGADLKNTFCLGRGREAFLSQHIGDLRELVTMDFFEESRRRLQALLGTVPQRVVCDRHPGYLSRRIGCSLGLPWMAVQHHWAHGAAVMAEHGLSSALGIIFDGTGLGPDKTIWGGEILHLCRTGYRRLAHLHHLALPGGDRAVREIWRLGLALLEAAGMPEVAATMPSLPVRKEEGRLVQAMIRQGVNSPLTSSCGRLFDGIAALVGIRSRVEFEAQAAMELETLAWQAASGQPKVRYPVELLHRDCLVLDHRPLVRQVVADIGRGVAAEDICWQLHAWLVRGVLKVLQMVARQCDERCVVLTGGCFQNRLLLDLLSQALEQQGYQVYTGNQVPVNDGGISLGQVAIGAAAWKC